MLKHLEYHIEKKRKNIFFFIEKLFSIEPSYALKENNLYIFLDENNSHTYILDNIPKTYLKKIGFREAFIVTTLNKKQISKYQIKLTK